MRKKKVQTEVQTTTDEAFLAKLRQFAIVFNGDASCQVDSIHPDRKSAEKHIRDETTGAGMVVPAFLVPEARYRDGWFALATFMPDGSIVSEYVRSYTVENLCRRMLKNQKTEFEILDKIGFKDYYKIPNGHPANWVISFLHRENEFCMRLIVNRQKEYQDRIDGAIRALQAFKI